jgi:hypothetical protein
MTGNDLIGGRIVRRVTVAMALAVVLAGCSWFRHGNAATSCSEPQLAAANAQTLPPLRAPEGLDPPDTHNGVHIPALAGTERVRGKNEPCLSLPPSYGNPVATPGMLQPPPAPQPAPTTATPGTNESPGSGGRAPLN